MIKRVLIILLLTIILLTSCNLPFDLDKGDKDVIPQNSSEVILTSPTPTITPTPEPKARITLGEQDLLYGDYDAAMNEFWLARSQSTDPEVIATAQLGIGRVLFLKSDYRGAVDQLIWLLNNFLDGATRNTAYFFLAKAYEGLDEYNLAADAYANYITNQPSALESEIQEMQADALVKAGDPAKAKEIYLLALQSAAPAKVDELSIKVAQASAASGDDADAISRYLAIYEASSADYIKSQVNLLLGQIYLRLGLPEQAYSRFQDSVTQFPTFFDSYSGLVALVEAGQPVNELLRGIVDYYAGQYGLATTALDRYMISTPEHDGTAHYYKALSLFKMADYWGEIAEWDRLIQDHPVDPLLSKAYLEKSSTQWRYLEDYSASTDTLLQFVARIPDSPEAPNYLFTAGSIYEIGGYLAKASKTWQRVFNEYPGYEKAYLAFFKSGIVTYRQKKYQESQIIFQRLLVLGTTPEDLAAANFWIAKSLEKQGKTDESQQYFRQSFDADPTGYYSIRAGEILSGESPFSKVPASDFAIDLEKERFEAERWMSTTFNLDTSIDLTSVGELSTNPLFRRGEEFWKLGMRDSARAEFESLRMELQGDALNTYRLMNKMLEFGFYQTAALSSRQVLDLAGLSQEATLTDAPDYFNHIRFGIFYRDLIVPAAVENDIDPLLLFSIIRQESLFDASIASSAGARGLMQITKGTGDFIFSNWGWPANYTSADLDRPFINVRLGAHYLKIWIDLYNGFVPAALASYNAGDSNTQIWMGLSGDDPDLFLEIIRFDETYNYIRYITENYSIYKSIYTHP